MLEAVQQRIGKPVCAGDPPPKSSDIWMPAIAGSRLVCTWEARQSGRAVDEFAFKAHGRRSILEAISRTGVAPCKVGYPMTHQIKQTWNTAPERELCGGGSHEIDLPGWACKSTRDQPL